MKERTHKEHHGKVHDQQSRSHKDGTAADERQADTVADSDIKLDFSWFKNASSRFKNVSLEHVVLVAFLAFAIALVFAIRMLPAALPMTDDWADNSIRQNVRAQVAQQIDAQFPSLPSANRQALIDKQTQELISGQQAAFDATKQQLSQQFKQQLRYTGADGNEYTYLGDLDSYFWLRYTRNILRDGDTCDLVTPEGDCRDMAVLAPVGAPSTFNPSLHVWAILGLYKIITPFNPDYPLPATSFLVPVIIGMIGVIPAFFIGRRLAGNVGGLFAAVVISLHPLLLSRSMGSDNDVWNVVLPLFILWMAIEAVEAKGIRSRITFAVLTSVFVGLHSATWDGWWFIYLIILFGFVGYLAFAILQTAVRDYQSRKRDASRNDPSRHDLKGWLLRSLWSGQTKKALTILGVFYVAAFLFLTIADHGTGYFSIPLQAVGTGAQLDRAVGSDYWPNVLTTVAELNKASIKDAIAQMGGASTLGSWMFFLSLAGILLLLLPRNNWSWRHFALLGAGALISAYLISGDHSRFVVLGLLALPILGILAVSLFDREHDIDIAPALIILLWFLASVYATYSGVRFILLMIPAFGVGFAVAVGRSYEWMSAWLRRDLPWNHYVTNIAVFAIIALLLITPVRAGRGTANGFMPSIDDSWWDGLTKIQQESAPDAIINSWWDFGHWFKYIADRRVTADGTTQHTHAPRWLGLALVTPEEHEAVGILRMLDCGNDAFPGVEGWQGGYGRILNVTNDSIKSEALMHELVVLDEQDARKLLLTRGFTQAQTDGILERTHCTPPENYFITSGDMIGKAGVWAHFGLWNFTRSYIAQASKTQPAAQAIPDIMQRFDMPEAEAKRLYYEAQGLTTEGAINQWVAPWPGFVMSDWSACQERTAVSKNTSADGGNKNRTLIVCPIGASIGQQAGASIVIDAFVYDPVLPQQSELQYGFYRDGVRSAQTSQGVPSSIIVADEKGMRELHFQNASSGASVLIDTKENRVLIADPTLLRSMFTQLYYLDGRYSDHFVKFYDRSGTSGRVLIWKVDWAGNARKNMTVNTTAIAKATAATSSANIVG